MPMKRFSVIICILLGFQIVGPAAPDLGAETAQQVCSPQEQSTLLALARDTLALYLNSKKVPDLKNYEITGLLHKTRGVFVTLKETKSGNLRGCIGYVRAVRPLAEAVRDCTIQAATRDRRFPPMQKNEDSRVYIDISVLSPPRKIRHIDEIDVGKHGLIIQKGMRSGILLPQVPVEWGWDRDEYLQAICRKAGLQDNGWRNGAELYVFTAQVFGEK